MVTFHALLLWLATVATFVSAISPLYDPSRFPVQVRALSAAKRDNTSSAPPDGSTSDASTTGPKSKAPDIKVSGNSIVDENGKKFQCHGVAIQGTEYQCAHGFGFGEGPGLNQDEVDGILKWGPSCVRVGINQGCFLGETIPGFNNSQYIGKPYVERITKWVDLLLANGLVVIVDLHWSSGGWVSLGQQIMPDKSSITFWKNMATIFNKPGIIFDLYNEPYPKSWSCWRDGGDACIDEDKSKLNFTAVGVQTLVDTVRKAGAKNPLLIECTEGAGGSDYSKYPKYAPKDPLNNIIAGIHFYSTLGQCAKPDCYKAQVAPVAKEFPIIVGELGSFMCDGEKWFGDITDFFDSLNIGYIVWSWFVPYGGPPQENPKDCNSLPYIIKDWDGTPNNYGVAVQKRLLSFKAGTAANGMPSGGNSTSSPTVGGIQPSSSDTKPSTATSTKPPGSPKKRCSDKKK